MAVNENFSDTAKFAAIRDASIGRRVR